MIRKQRNTLFQRAIVTALAFVMLFSLSFSTSFSSKVQAAPGDPLVFEGESLPPTLNPATGLSTKFNSEAAASGGKNYQVTFKAVGQWVEFPVNVPDAGTYEVIFGYKKNSGRGIFQSYLDGAALGGPVDQYIAGSSAGYFTSSLGTAEFTAGTHQFRFAVTGRNPSSTTYDFVIDYLKLVPKLAVDVTNVKIRPKADHPNVVSVTTDTYSVDVIAGTTAGALLAQVESTDGSAQTYAVTDANGAAKAAGAALVTGDKLTVTAENGTAQAVYALTVPANETSPGVLTLPSPQMTAGTVRNIQLHYDVTSKVPPITGVDHPVYPTWEVIFTLPDEITAATGDEVSIVGAEKRKLTAGEISNGGKTVTLQNLELQPENGTDVLLYLNAKPIPPVNAQGYEFKATNAIQGKSHSQGTSSEKATLTSVSTVSDFKRAIKVERYSDPDYTKTQLSWIAPHNASNVKVEMSTDNGGTWSEAAFTAQTRTITPDDVYKIRSINGELVNRKPGWEVVDLDKIVVGLHELPKYAVGVSVTTADVTGLQLNQNYQFRLNVTGGDNAGISNPAKYRSAFFNILDYGAVSAASEATATNNTAAIQAAYDAAAATGGGTVYVPPGIYGQGTIHMRSNVYLYLAAGAELYGLKGFIDDPGPALNPYQDFGHSHHSNAMFVGLRVDNVKIIGTGMIHGGTGITGSDPSTGSNQGDKQVSILLSTNYEFGGYGAPAGNYAANDKTNKIQINRGGHFQLLSNGVDYVDIHDMYVNVLESDTPKQVDANGKVWYDGSKYRNRDIFDLMSDSYVSIANVYSEFSADDVVKLGSDYALGFKKHSGNYRVDNIEAWTWCNGFQIGSETVGDISNIHASNFTIHEADKAAISISVNDGMTVNNLLFDGNNYTELTKSPLNMTISNRGRRPGGPEINQVGGIKNVTVKNVVMRDARNQRSDQTFAPTISGFYNKSDGNTTYAENITFENIDLVTKTAAPAGSKDSVPVEMPTNYPNKQGNYNVGDIGQRPSYGFYARHVKNFVLKDSTFTFEDGQDDGRYAVAVEDVVGATLDHLTVPKLSALNDYLVKVSKSGNVTFKNSAPLADMNGVNVPGSEEYPHDATPPVTTAQIAQTGQNGWYNSDVTVTLTAQDDYSGVVKTEYKLAGDADWTTYTGPVAFANEGVYQLQYRSTDKAGNVEAAKEQTVRIDKTPPIVSLTADGAPFADGSVLKDDQTPTFKLIVQDALSGVASQAMTLDGKPFAGETPLDLAGMLGSHSLRVTVIDQAGNTSDQTFSFKVDTSIPSLRALIARYTDSGDLNGPLVPQLNNSLDQAEHQLGKGSADNAAKHLQDFLKHLDNASKNRNVTEAAKAVLAADAQALIDAWTK